MNMQQEMNVQLQRVQHLQKKMEQTQQQLELAKETVWIRMQQQEEQTGPRCIIC